MGLISLYEMWKLRKGKSKLIALLYVIIPFCIVQLFGFSDHNYPTSNFDPSPILIMFILTWVFDTFAYLTGSKFGKNKILPKISPKKTWEGFWGGALACVVSSFFLIPYHPTFPVWTFPTLAGITVVAATVGDLIQSKFKRQAKVKDSGSLIPGHGGFYDRMDSVLFTAPFIYLFLMFIRYVS